MSSICLLFSYVTVVPIQGRGRNLVFCHSSYCEQSERLVFGPSPTWQCLRLMTGPRQERRTQEFVLQALYRLHSSHLWYTLGDFASRIPGSLLLGLPRHQLECARWGRCWCALLPSHVQGLEMITFIIYNSAFRATFHCPLPPVCVHGACIPSVSRSACCCLYVQLVYESLVLAKYSKIEVHSNKWATRA